MSFRVMPTLCVTRISKNLGQVLIIFNRTRSHRTSCLVRQVGVGQDGLSQVDLGAK